MTASFGPPAPLPGQPGFRARPSDAMAKETAEMEERLARLKTDLAAEAEMREATGPRVGGSRWRSARTDRGSVRAYAKDVKTRHKQQMQQRPPHGIFATGGGGGAGFGGGMAQPQAGAGARAAAALRDEQQRLQHHHYQQHRQQQPPAETRKGGTPTASASKASPAFKSKEVSRWGVGDTVEWLKSLGLGKHAGVFQQNEISGPILLEVGLDDLDYMEVRVLAHRKCILKGIEDLRRGVGRPLSVDTPPPPAPITPSLPKASYTSGSERSTGGAVGNQASATSTQQSGDSRSGGDRQPSPAARKKQHWSVVKPLAENPTKGDAQDSLSSVNLADGHYDEAGARSSFADAVAAWRGEGRNSTTTTTTTTASAEEAPAPSLHRPSVVGRAPLAGMPAERPEEENTKRPGKSLKRGLLGGGEGSGGATEHWTNPFSTPRASGTGAAAGEEPHSADPEHKQGFSARRAISATTAVVDASQQGASGLGQNGAPALDEEAEHEAFRRAVAEWNRMGGKNLTAEREGGCSSDGGVGTGSHPAEPSGATAGTETLPNRRTTEAMAEELREQMDAEHRLQAKELEEKKRALLEGMETAASGLPTLKTGARQEADHPCGGDDGENRGSSSPGGRSPGGSSGGDGFEGHGSEQYRHEDVDDDGDDDRSTVSSTTSVICAPAAYGSPEENVDEELPRGGRGDFEPGGDGGGVEIEMMESVLGADWSVEDGKSYVVDEVESGDES